MRPVRFWFSPKMTLTHNVLTRFEALTILAHKLARAVYYMLIRKTAFDMDKFLHG
jgi:hypothetical protein